MRSSAIRTIIMIIGGISVVAGSFLLTLKILDYASVARDPQPDVIHVAVATYGLSCYGFLTPQKTITIIKEGNATAAVSKHCEGVKRSCDYVVSPAELGDPAGGCGKDFIIGWRCGADSTIHEALLKAEAVNKTASVKCPVPSQ